jgi:hypothetical protein
MKISSKNVWLGRFEQEFIEDRRRQLELWLNRICHHPVLCASFPVQHFITCELTEKNNKVPFRWRQSSWNIEFLFQDWKAGKRKIEKDELRESSWLHCVTVADSKLSEIEMYVSLSPWSIPKSILSFDLVHLTSIYLLYNNRLLKHIWKILVMVLQNISNDIQKFMNVIFNGLENSLRNFI